MNYSIKILKDQKQIIDALLKTDFNSKSVAEHNAKLADLCNSIETLETAQQETIKKTVEKIANQKQIFDEST